MDSFSQCLDAVKEYCKQYITEAAYNLWINGLEAESFNGDSAVLSASSEFLRSNVESRYLNCFMSQTHIKTNSVRLTYTFDNFIIGPDNRFAHAAAIAVAANPSNAYNPLFIYGSSGLGKTHLLYAIKNQLAQTRPELKVLYIGGDSFTNELIAAIKSGSTEPFHEKYRNVDVLLDVIKKHLIKAL